MFIAKIRRYHATTGNLFLQIEIPQRVTITGRENHYARAYEDAQMAIAGMRELDEKLGNADGTTYDIVSLADQQFIGRD